MRIGGTTIHFWRGVRASVLAQYLLSDTFHASSSESPIKMCGATAEWLDRTSLRLAHLLDNFLSAGEQRGRHRNTKRFGGLEIDHQLNFCRLLHRKFSRFGALENPTCIPADFAIHISETDPVAN